MTQIIGSAVDQPVKNILLTGAHGMIGSALTQHLTKAGYKVFALDRHSANSSFHYLADSNEVVLEPDIPLYAVINLAGPNIGEKRWTSNRKVYLKRSRTNLTQALAKSVATLPVKPTLFLSASAVGYYGQTGDAPADEFSSAGSDFLASIAKDWEASTSLAEIADINTIHLRLGVVLSMTGGMLKQLLLPFKLGLGGRVGDGSQYISWIHIEDVIHIISQLLETNPSSGPLNLVSGHAVTNAEFSMQLAGVLNRPCLLPLPAIIARLIFGEMADALLLGNCHVRSAKLDELGIQLKYPTLRPALQSLLRAQKQGTDHD